MKRLFLLISLLCSACSSQPHALLPAKEQIRADLQWLAADDRQGRLSGSRGATESSIYIESRFRQIGLAPFFADGYQQSFSLIESQSIATDTHLDNARLQVEYSPLNSSANAYFSARLAFVGYGIDSDQYKYSDYQDLDVRGRIAIAMRYEPHDDQGKSSFTHAHYSSEAAITRKAQVAADHGAIALLLVNPPKYHEKDAPLRVFNPRSRDGEVSPIPVISISPDYAASLLGKDLDLASLQEKIDQTQLPQSRLLNRSLTGNINIKRNLATASNVVAVLPGIGLNRDEYVILGAHYDHLGHGEVGSRKPGSTEIFNGADDNASGVSAVLQIARELSATKLNRSVIFILFSGEEEGLLGSKYFVDHMLLDPRKIRAMINLDMVGRFRKATLYVGGNGTDPTFNTLLSSLASDQSIHIQSIGGGGIGPSDFQPFAQKKIPVLFFYTGTHDQYHRPEDDVALINFNGIEQIASLTRALIQQLTSDTRQNYIDRYDKDPLDVEIDPDKPATRPVSR